MTDLTQTPPGLWSRDGDDLAGWHVSEQGYNYDRFDSYVEGGAEEREFGAFPDLLHAGDVAPEISGVLLDGASLSLSQVWATRPVVVEFGSFT